MSWIFESIELELNWKCWFNWMSLKRKRNIKKDKRLIKDTFVRSSLPELFAEKTNMEEIYGEK